MLYLSIIVNLLRTSMTIIYAGNSFNYENYHLLADVVEGEVLSVTEDNVTFRVTDTWTESSRFGDELSPNTRYEVGLEEGDTALFLVDSTGWLTIYGLARNGCYLMSGRSSPDILTVDDLYYLSRGEEPEFNQHESRITVRFPLSSDEISIRVNPADDGRRISSQYPEWDNKRPSGEISLYTGAGFSIPTGNESSIGLSTIYFLGEVSKYSGGTFFLDAWPRYPCFSSRQSVEDFYEHGTVPVYVFRIELENPDYWSIGLPDEAYMVTLGDGFYLRGRQRFGEEDNSRYFGNRDLIFRAFASGATSHYPYRRTMLRIEGLDSPLNSSLLAAMLQAAENGSISGNVYFLESEDAEPELYSSCTISLASPEFTLSTHCSTDVVSEMNEAILSFTETGLATLESNGTEYEQIQDYQEYPYTVLRNSVCTTFRIPDTEGEYLILNFPDIYLGDRRKNADKTLVAELIDEYLARDRVDGVFYYVNSSESNPVSVGSFTLTLR